MTLHVDEVYINLTRGYRFGESEVYDTGYEPDEIGKLFRWLQQEYGRCTSKVYIDGPPTRQVGWVFEKRMEYEDSRPRYDDYGRRRKPDTYIREVWVTVHEAPPTKTTEFHYHDFGRVA